MLGQGGAAFYSCNIEKSTQFLRNDMRRSSIIKLSAEYIHPNKTPACDPIIKHVLLMSNEALKYHRLDSMVYFKAGSLFTSITIDFSNRNRYPPFGTYQVEANR